jgi:hypothetical protein
MCKKLFVLVLVLGLAGTASADLRGYWKLDGDGTDSSTYGNHGIISDNVAPTADRFGNPNGAMYFTDGLGNINVGDDASLNLTGAMTITGWVYLDSSSPVHGARNSRILGKMDGGGARAWSSGIEKNINNVPLTATLQISPDGSGVKSFHEAAQVSLPTDQWVHYAGVYNPGVSMEVFLNGDSIGIETIGVPASQYSANGHPVLIGNRPACGDCGWYGALDEVRIYSDVLTEPEIEAIMAIPEPTTMLMLSLGGLALIRKKR